MKKCFLHQAGFTFIELIVVIVIMSVVTVGGFITYNSFAQSLDLDNAHDFVMSILDDKQLAVANGSNNCAQILFFKDETYFLTIEHNQRYCDAAIPLVGKFGLNQQNELRVEFKSDQSAKIIEKIDANGNMERIEVAEGLLEQFIPLLSAQYYRFVIYEEANQEKTQSVWGLYYFSEKNVEQENTDQILVSKITASDLNNQAREGQKLLLKFAYPDAQIKSYLDQNLMREGQIELTKLNTTADPTVIGLADLISESWGLTSRTRLIFKSIVQD